MLKFSRKARVACWDEEAQIFLNKPNKLVGEIPSPTSGLQWTSEGWYWFLGALFLPFTMHQIVYIGMYEREGLSMFFILWCCSPWNVGSWSAFWCLFFATTLAQMSTVSGAVCGKFSFCCLLSSLQLKLQSLMSSRVSWLFVCRRLPISSRQTYYFISSSIMVVLLSVCHDHGRLCLSLLFISIAHSVERNSSQMWISVNGVEREWVGQPQVDNRTYQLPVSYTLVTFLKLGHY